MASVTAGYAGHLSCPSIPGFPAARGFLQDKLSDSASMHLEMGQNIHVHIHTMGINDKRVTLKTALYSWRQVLEKRCPCPRAMHSAISISSKHFLHSTSPLFSAGLKCSSLDRTALRAPPPHTCDLQHSQLRADGPFSSASLSGILDAALYVLRTWCGFCSH